MMEAGLETVYDTIDPPPMESTGKPVYAVMPVQGYKSYFVGKDCESNACLLVAMLDRETKHQAPIRLESLDVQFALLCQLRHEGQTQSKGTFTVIRCRSLDREIIRYFLSLCRVIIRMVGDNPLQGQVSLAVDRLASMLQEIGKPPSRSVNGLFGELYLLWRSRNPVRALAAWRTNTSARFDFSDGDIRLDVKATGGRVRIHTFSYDQCNPPPGTVAVVASLFVEQAPGGMALQLLIDEIEARIAAHIDLVLKLHEVVATTLGRSLKDALALTFDVKLTDSSLRFFSLLDVPAIRGSLPGGVSDVNFRSDLSDLRGLSAQSLIDRDAVFWDLLPHNR